MQWTPSCHVSTILCLIPLLSRVVGRICESCGIHPIFWLSSNFKSSKCVRNLNAYRYSHFYFQLFDMIFCFQGFYKRSTTRAEKYKCFFGGSCKLNPQNRNRCKACRYQICLDMGMSMDGECNDIGRGYHIEQGQKKRMALKYSYTVKCL